MKIVIVLLLTLSISLYSETLESIDDVITYSTANSRSYRAAAINYLKATDDLDGILELESTTISIKADIDNEKSSLKYSLIAPVTDQISLFGELDDNNDGNFGISINPFNINSDSTKSKLGLKLAELELESAYLSAATEAVELYLKYFSSGIRLDYFRDMVAISKELYEDSKIRYSTGDISLDELSDSQKELTKTRKDLVDQENLYRELETSLYTSLGATYGEVDIKNITTSSLKSEIDNLVNELEISNGNYLKDSNYIETLINKEVKDKEVDFTWYYDPKLSADINFSYMDSVAEFSAISLNYSFSLNDIGIKDRELAMKEYELALFDSEMNLERAKNSFTTHLSQIESSKSNSELAKMDMDDSIALYKEALILYQSGEYSEIELKVWELNMVSSEITYYEALIEELILLLDFKKYL